MTCNILRRSMRCAGIAMFAMLVACGQQAPSELQWARAALERNPQVKVVSINEQANTLQIRVKASGEMVTVTPGELAAIPIGDLLALIAPPPIAEPVATPPEAPVATATPIPLQLAPESAPIAASEPPAAYTVQREDGRVRISGPGVSIESTAGKTSQAPRYDDPIICEGRRTLHLDNRRIQVDGDALIARGGCELRITNSEIHATNTGLIVMDATVHISNSTVQGDAASLQLGPKAKAFLRGATFKGISRRDPLAEISDLGGNVWQ